MNERSWTWTKRLAAPPERVWPLLADTDRFNRFIGVPPVRFTSFPLARGARREGAFRVLGMNVTWDEYPFEFVEPRLIAVLRRYHGGPLLEMESRIEIAAVEGGSEVRHSLRAVPRHVGGRAVAWLQIGVVTGRGIKRFHETLERALEAGEAILDGPPALEPALTAQLRATLGDLPNAERLVGYLERAPEPGLRNLRPFRLARQWRLPRDESLRLFLQATRLGVLDAAWALICPHCRGVQSEAGALRELAFEGLHCDSCNEDFTADFDRLTELTFNLSARWKKLEGEIYCIGGPGRMPHVAAQLRVPAGKTGVLRLSLPPGAYRLRSAVSDRAAQVTIDAEGVGNLACRLDEAGVSPADLRAAPGGELAITNPTAAEATVKLERTAWADDACTAANVAVFQDFRDLFGADVLAPGVSVKVGHVAILFTDLKGSTALYQQAGDAAAFGLVRDHFDRLIDVVRRHEGAVVKTIGDAVMAAFADLPRALAAAIAMHAAVADMRTPEGEPVVLKVGLHAGPSFAVTLSDRLDYFGTTVNLAARVQGQSEGGDVVLDATLAASPAVADLLAGRAGEPFKAELKGIQGGAVSLVRYRVTPLEA